MELEAFEDDQWKLEAISKVELNNSVTKSVSRSYLYYYFYLLKVVVLYNKLFHTIKKQDLLNI